MLYLKYSRDWKRNADLAVKEICGVPETGISRQILIVPEQNSFDAEWALCEQGGETISRRAEVLSFTRLATRVFSEVGGVAVTALDKSGRMIAMAGALEQLRPRLKLYGAHVSKPEFLQQLLEIVDEFHGYGIRCEDVRKARASLDGALSDKLEELCLILEAYDAVCAGALQDPSTRLDRLCEAIYECEYIKHARIVVEGFSDFTNQELNVLEALMVRSDQVTVYLTCDSLTGGQSVFSVPRQTAQALKRLAGRHGILCRTAAQLETVEETPLRHLAAGLFAPKLTAWPEKAEEIALCAARNTVEECEALVAAVQRLLLAGDRYRDLAVAYTDAEAYGPLLENLFDRYGIPAYYAGDQELLRQPVVRCVLYALEAAACGMEPESISEYLKSGYAPVSAAEADRLENYGFVWRLRGSRWEQPFSGHPLGLQKDHVADEESLQTLLAPLNAARDLAIGPLSALKQGLLSAKNTSDQLTALEDFLQAVQLPQQLERRTEALLAANSLQQAQELSQLYEILLGTMEQIHGVLGRTVRSPEDFYRFFRAALTQNAVGTIPAALDCVRVGQLSAMRHAGARHLLVLGACDGLFPAFAGSAGLLTDSERQQMKWAGLPSAPDDSERLDRELLTAYCVLTAPEKSLFVSAVADSPSYLYLRLAAMFPDRAEADQQPLPADRDQLAARIAAGSEADRRRMLRQLPELAGPVEALRELADYKPGALKRTAVRALYGDRLSLNPSKVDKFASCRFAYFLRYGLSLQEQRPAEVDASMFGVFVHEVLERTVSAVQEEGGFRAVSLERTLQLSEGFCDRFAEEHLPKLTEASERSAYLFRRNYLEVFHVIEDLYAELRDSAFIPTSFELAFAGDTAIPITGNLAVGSLRGVVDRVDLFTTRAGKTYLRVVDYKTGEKSFDYTDLLEGVGLQMLIYLFALTREAERFYGKPLEPAGVLYFPARYRVESTRGRCTPEEVDKERRKALTRKGLLLEDDEILRAMEPRENPVYLPFKYVKTSKTRSGSLADAPQLRQLERYVDRTLGRLADEIWEGRIEAEPYWRNDKSNACRYCEYREVCRIDSGELPLRRRKTVKQQQFWETVEKEAESHGD